MTSSLSDLVASAKGATGLDRIEYRSDIAAFGDDGIAAVLPLALFEKGGIAWFAVSVIEAASPHGTRSVAVDALRRVAASGIDGAARQDAQVALGRLEPTKSAPTKVAPVPAVAGHDWPGFQENEFGEVTGTVWRGRDNPRALSPIITRSLRYLHPHFESYSIYHSPAVHFGIRDRYQQGGEHLQGWRAGKLVVYAHGPTGEEPDLEPMVTAGLYLERGLVEAFDGAPEDLLKFGLLDDHWDWVWFLRALREPHLQDELGAAMVRHDLRIGDYWAWRIEHVGSSVGWVCELVDGEPTMVRTDGSVAGRGWDAVRESLEQAPRRQWVDLHVWRTWPAAEAIATGPDFAARALVPVLTDLGRIYLDVLASELSSIPPIRGA